MDTEIMVAKDLAEEDISSALENFFLEESINTRQLENRWKKGFNEIFSYTARLVARFFASQIKTSEVEQTQSFIRRFFCKTGYIEKIKNDYQLQNAFMLGYCHGINELIDCYEAETSYQRNNTLKSVISSYKYVTPVLKILDIEFEVNHKELAKKIGISETALSNFMNSIKKYHLINYTRVGKNKFYSIAYPNGEEALRIVKEKNKISVDRYTEFLLEMMDSLIDISTCDELGKEYVLKKCEKMILQYTTKPALCKKKLEQLTFISKSERVYYISLMNFETKVKEKVTVFTRDFRSEKNFYETIIKNLGKNIRYQWFVTETDEFNTAEKVQETFLGYLMKYANLDNLLGEKFKKNMHCYIIPKNETDTLLGNIYDAVIYDESKGFSCVDKTIADKTPYIQMPQDKLEMLNQYVKSKNNI